jgi:hypothetical protein
VNGAPVYVNGYPQTWHRFRISQISWRVKEMLILGKFLLSQTCCSVHTSRRVGYIVMATGGLNAGISGLEDHIPRHAERYISSLFLAAAIAAPTAMMAGPKLQGAASRSESTIETTVIIITGPTTRPCPQALPGSTVGNYRWGTWGYARVSQ